jgi:branched-chain amino acid transport system substrate-binding protein
MSRGNLRRLLMRTHRHALRALVLIVGITGGACMPGVPTGTPAEVRLGLITTLTGELAESYGSSTVDAAKLAVQPINDAGGLDLGGQKYKVTLFIEDDQDRAEVATRAAQKLINQDRVVALVGPSLSRNAIPVADVAEGAHIPMISPNSTNPATTVGKKYVFRVDFIDPFQGRVIARFARDELHASSAAVLYDVASAYNKGIAEVFKDVFAESGGRVVAFESYTSGEKDFRQQIARIKQSGADVLFLPNYDNDVPMQAQQVHQNGITATLLGADAWGTLKPENLGELEGSFFSTDWTIEAPAARSQEFVKRFRDAYSRPPNNIAALAYDSVGLLLTSLRIQGKADPEAIRSGLSGITDYAGATGTIGYGGGNGDPVKSALILQIKGGQVVLARQVDP